VVKILSDWGKYQTAEEMEISRKYEYDLSFLPFLYEWLGLKPDMMVVDVGCGSGYFTRILARGLKEEGKVVGVDPDETLILEAEEIAEREEFSNIEFKVGSIYKIPLPDNYADLVVCHIVLCNITRQFDAILEMKRVAKNGGKVAVIEPAKGGGTCYPDKKLNELYERFRRAFGTALDKEWRHQKPEMSDYIENIYLKLPQLFLKAGLTNIALNGYLSTFLLCDTKRSMEEIQRYLKARLVLWRKLKKRNKEYVLIGGMKEEEFEELFQRYVDYLGSLVNNPEKIRQTAEVEIVSRVIVCGSKGTKKT
jgi:ubiquinone/menaquinone biosynthesis C-methylase UbiE